MPNPTPPPSPLQVAPTLGHLIEGESLFNDGTAIVLFSYFQKFIFYDGFETDPNDPTTKQVNLFSVFTKVLYMAFGGLFVGFMIGRGCIMWITNVFNDPLVEITITIAFTYLTFFVAEIWFEVSGVMAVVAMGMVINSYRTQISPEVEHFLHKFWQMTGLVQRVTSPFAP